MTTETDYSWVVACLLSADDEASAQAGNKRLSKLSWLEPGSLFSDKCPYVWPDSPLKTEKREEDGPKEEEEPPKEKPSAERWADRVTRNLPAQTGSTGAPLDICLASELFGDANFHAQTIVLGKQLTDPIRLLVDLKRVANARFGVVPIMNTFTCRPPTKPFTPRSPPIPTEKEIQSTGLCLIQVGYPNGRQALFQTLATAANGKRMEDMVGGCICMTQEEGTGVVMLRAVQPLHVLIAGEPEIAYMRVLGEATQAFWQRVSATQKLAADLLKGIRSRLHNYPSVARTMEIIDCELQLDGKKLIIYADMEESTNFNEFVKGVRIECENQYGLAPRIFIMRRFV